MLDHKTSAFEAVDAAPHVDLEQPIAEMNRALAPVEHVLTERFEMPLHPTVFIVGAPRSGSTLLSQLLIARYRIGYVSNLTARFWNAPYLGMLLASELHDEGRLPAVGLDSNLGATPGYEGPHEFGYFWRRWFKYGETHVVSEEALKGVDVALLRRECAAMESVSGQPFLFKNLVCSFQITFLAEVFPRAIFVHCRRGPLFVAQSLLRARVRYCGSKDDWFSVKPAAYPSLRKCSYADQIAGQIFHVRAHVEQAFEMLPSHRFCHVDYEALTEHPEASLKRIADLVAASGDIMQPRTDFSFPSLASTNEHTVAPKDLKRLQESCRQIFREEDAQRFL